MTSRRPQVLLGEWRHDADCQHVDPELFFPDSGDYRAAKAVCNGCPVRVECLQHALKHERDSMGVWGGLGPGERRLEARRRRREARKAVA